MSKTEQVKTLVELGLTELQARVYFAILFLEEATAKEARIYSKVARQDIYRILKELHKLSLVEKIITRPTRFTAIQLQEATSILLENKRKKIVQLEKKTKKLLHNFQKPSKIEAVTSAYSAFTLAPHKKEPLLDASKSIGRAEKRINFISNVTRIWYMMTNYQEYYEKAIKDGIEIRYILKKSKNCEKMMKYIEQFVAKTSIKVRYISHPYTPPIAGIIDEKEAYIIISPSNSGVTEECILHSTNRELVEIIKYYFEYIWNQTTQTGQPPQTTSNKQST